MSFLAMSDDLCRAIHGVSRLPLQKSFKLFICNDLSMLVEDWYWQTPLPTATLDYEPDPGIRVAMPTSRAVLNGSPMPFSHGLPKEL